MKICVLDDNSILLQKGNKWECFTNTNDGEGKIYISEYVDKLKPNSDFGEFLVYIESVEDVIIPPNFKCEALYIDNCVDVTIKEGLQCNILEIVTQTGKLKLPKQLKAEELILLKKCDGLVSIPNDAEYDSEYIEIKDCENFVKFGNNVLLLTTKSSCSTLELTQCSKFKSFGKNFECGEIIFDDDNSIKSFNVDIKASIMEGFDGIACIQLGIISMKQTNDIGHICANIIYMLKYMIAHNLLDDVDEDFIKRISKCKVTSEFEDIHLTKDELSRWDINYMDTIIRFHRLTSNAGLIVHKTDNAEKDLKQLRDTLFDKLDAIDVNWKSIGNVKKYWK